MNSRGKRILKINRQQRAVTPAIENPAAWYWRLWEWVKRYFRKGGAAAHAQAVVAGFFARVQDYRLLEGAGGSTVIRHVAKAAEAGYLIVDARERDNGSSSSNIFRSTMPEGGVAQRHNLVAHSH